MLLMTMIARVDDGLILTSCMDDEVLLIHLYLNT